MNDEVSTEKNVLGGPLLACSFAPLTGFFRDGCCAARGEQGVAHLVCVRVTAEFLAFSRECGNDLSTPIPEMRFRGLHRGTAGACTCCAGSRPGRPVGHPRSCSRRPTNRCSSWCRCRRSSGTRLTCTDLPRDIM